ncbi:Purine-cytosine permease fcy22 [Pleurostoma richardsiae]|uniref:Purine-cytosine permease fcy22 n=1 Tax=Pleurostoma richardsiae TaxID=41990 RepID=A0AA38RZR6_9PEZI|nr:Purine-cytosine permease fcy22 [Pleurostoma richardsiae]
MDAINTPHTGLDPSKDLEKSLVPSETSVDVSPADVVPSADRSLWTRLSEAGVELRGAQPVPVELRTDTRYFNIFTIFSTSMTSLLPISIGSATTLFYGLNLRDAALMIIFFDIIFCLPAAYIVTIAPRTGMRQMIQSRYTFGKYGNILTVIVVIMTVGGFSCTATSVAGNCLAYLSDGKLSSEVGMMIIVLVSLVVAFFGYRILHLYERWAWIPILIAIVFTIGCAGENLAQPPLETPTTKQEYMGMIALIAGSQITWAMVAGDYCVYMPPTTPRFRLGMYCLTGICIPFTLLMIVGAAIGGAISANPTWETAYAAHGIGGVLGAILDRVGGFGKFILALMALSVIATVSRDYYTVSVNIQALVPIFRKVPRAVFVIVTAGAAYGVAFAASKTFYDSLVTFLSIIGYYGGSFVSVVFIEWFYFRKADPDSFDPEIWNDAKRLPTGIPALASVLLPWALIVPSMDQTWYTGPIAKNAGDLGFWFAIILAALFYPPFRALEIRLRGGKL